MRIICDTIGHYIFIITMKRRDFWKLFGAGAAVGTMGFGAYLLYSPEEEKPRTNKLDLKPELPQVELPEISQILLQSWASGVEQAMYDASFWGVVLPGPSTKSEGSNQTALARINLSEPGEFNRPPTIYEPMNPVLASARFDGRQLVLSLTPAAIPQTEDAAPAVGTDFAELYAKYLTTLTIKRHIDPRMYKENPTDPGLYITRADGFDVSLSHIGENSQHATSSLNEMSIAFSTLYAFGTSTEASALLHIAPGLERMRFLMASLIGHQRTEEQIENDMNFLGLAYRLSDLKTLTAIMLRKSQESLQPRHILAFLVLLKKSTLISSQKEIIEEANRLIRVTNHEFTTFTNEQERETAQNECTQYYEEVRNYVVERFFLIRP